MVMTINSLSFLVFFGVLTILYYLLRPKYQWILLLTASLAFYALAGTRNFFWLLATCVTTYGAVCLMERLETSLSRRLTSDLSKAPLETKKAEKARVKKQKRRILALLLVINIGILALLKYCDFFIVNLNHVLGFFGVPKVNTLGLLAPLGISYYTLQSMGYALDVYKGKCKPEHNFFKTMLFISFFPQMTQGPIGRFPDLAPQLFSGCRFSYENLSFGLQRSLWGFFKKCVIADRMKPMVDAIFASDTASGMTLFLGCIYLTVQMYADFSGYVDIVSGFSEVLGIHLAENFKRPFFSQSLAEYWRRWHISLSSWFRDYLFYPLSISKPAVRFGKFGKKHFGIRIGKIFPAVYALFIVWFSTGLWHDSSWRYILWGVSNGIIIIGAMWLEPLFTKGKALCHIQEDQRWWKIFRIFRTFLLVSLLKVFPGPSSTKGTLDVIRRIFTDFRPSLSYEAWFPKLAPEHIGFVLFGLVLFWIVSMIQEKHPVRPWLAQKPFALRWALYFLLLGSILTMGAFSISMVGGFAYAQF
jgi:alginate O-acetyltransferase complex protein AlgI